MSVPRINGVQLSDPSAGPLLLLGNSIGTSGTRPVVGECGVPRRAISRRRVGPAWSRPQHRANSGRVHAWQSSPPACWHSPIGC